MVLELAPNASSSGRFQMSTTAVSTADTSNCVTKQLPRICSASAVRFLPKAMEARGAPPLPTNAAKAEMIRISGIHTPTPVSASAPSPGMWPM